MKTQRHSSYQDLLVEELRVRRSQNRRYSLRSFAKFLEISPAQLSQMMSGKRNLSKKQAVKIAEKLGLSSHQVRTILSPISYHTAEKPGEFTVLKDEDFSLISDWKYYALLSLANLSKNKSDPQWIARRLGISSAEASRVFEELLKLGYINLLKSGSFKQISKPLTVKSPSGSQSIRRFHKSISKLAMEKLESVETSKRFFSSVTLGFNPKKLEHAQKLITDFRRAFAAEMEIGEKTEVYNLAIQFFPMTTLEPSET